MRVYIAAAFELRKTEAANLRTWLQKEGHEVTSSWIDETEDECVSLAGRQLRADSDLSDIDDADALVVINPPGSVPSWGRAFETGYACRAGMPVFLYGASTSVFHDLDTITVCPTLAELVEELRELEETLDRIDWP